MELAQNRIVNNQIRGTRDTSFSAEHHLTWAGPRFEPLVKLPTYLPTQHACCDLQLTLEREEGPSSQVSLTPRIMSNIILQDPSGPISCYCSFLLFHDPPSFTNNWETQNQTSSLYLLPSSPAQVLGCLDQISPQTHRCEIYSLGSGAYREDSRRSGVRLGCRFCCIPRGLDHCLQGGVNCKYVS